VPDWCAKNSSLFIDIEGILGNF